MYRDILSPAQHPHQATHSHGLDSKLERTRPPATPQALLFTAAAETHPATTNTATATATETATATATATTSTRVATASLTSAPSAKRVRLTNLPRLPASASAPSVASVERVQLQRILDRRASSNLNQDSTMNSAGQSAAPDRAGKGDRTDKGKKPLYKLDQQQPHELSYELQQQPQQGTSSQPAMAAHASPRSHLTALPAPAKKLVIKAFKVKPALPESFEADTWNKLQRAVVSIYNRKPVPDSLEELYKACENLCHHSKQDTLYNKLTAECKLHVTAELSRIKMQVKPTMLQFCFVSYCQVDVLKLVNDCWSNFCQQMILIRSIFLYLDRTYVLQNPTLKSIWNMSIDMFRDYIMNDREVQRRTLDALLQEIERDRNGDLVARPLLRSLLRMLVDLNIYIYTFETPFLESTRTFYRKLGIQHVHSINDDMHAADSVAQYLIQVDDRLAQENLRCDPSAGYVDSMTRKRLIQVVETELIQSHAITLLDAGFDTLVTEQRVDDLKLFYKLLDRVEMLSNLRDRLAKYIKAKGTDIVKDLKDPARDKIMVTSMLTFKSKLDQLLRDSFFSSELFSVAIKDSFETFINTRPNKPAEMIAKHVDELMKQTKTLTEAEIDQQLDQCLTLFRFIQGKDVFEAFYGKDLAKRLLFNRSASIDAEKSMLSKLKAECGAGFTQKLEAMFKDMDLSKDFQRLFEATPGLKEKIGSIDLSVSVLQANAWPTFPKVDVILPVQLATCQTVFKDFYISKHSGRTLEWQNYVGSCVVRAQFGKTKELQVSLFQTLILLCFNDTQSLSFAEIGTQTGIETKELARSLQSLSCGKFRILIKTSKGSEIDTINDVFQVNEAFESSQFRIKINTIQVRETVEEQAKTSEKVFADRVFQIDAAIVRVMKSEKTATMADLSAKVHSLVGFPFEAND
eukprot:jgi/Hompol1/3054/HPOL_000021-RA